MGQSRWHTSHAQIQALAALRSRFGGLGHRICGMAKKFKTHQTEFVVLIQDPSPRALLVRPARLGSITIQPTECPALYTKEKEIVQAMKGHCPVVWLDQANPKGPHYMHYIALEDRKRLGLERGWVKPRKLKTPPSRAA